MQIETTMNYHFESTRMATIKKKKMLVRTGDWKPYARLVGM